MTPPSVTPQGAQLKRYKIDVQCLKNGNDIYRHVEADNGDVCMWRDVAPLAERIAALEQQLAEARRDADYRLWKLELVIPLFQEARDALTALTVEQIRLRGIPRDLANRMDYAGTADVEQYLEALAARQPEKDANNG